jgi:hypothetical protein
VEITPENTYLCTGRNGKKYFRGKCRKCLYEILEAYNKEWARNHPQYENARHASYYRRNKENLRKRRSARASEQRFELLSHYSGAPPFCADPFGLHAKPFVDLRCLLIDHIQGNGSVHRRELAMSGQSLYSWICKNNFPPGFQVLCANCQFVKKIVNREDKFRPATVAQSM